MAIVTSFSPCIESSSSLALLISLRTIFVSFADFFLADTHFLKVVVEAFLGNVELFCYKFYVFVLKVSTGCLR